MANKHMILSEMIAKQRKTDNEKYHLEPNDLSRVCKNIDSSIFQTEECVLWKKFLTKSNDDKSCYVNFYLRKNKFALHRILYINFIAELKSNQYLKYTCDNPGQCCNLSHFYKVNENEKEGEYDEYEETDTATESNVTIHGMNSPNGTRSKLILIFND